MPARLVSAGAGTRVEVQAYLRFLVDAGQDPRFTSDRLMQEINGIVALPRWERALYRYLLIPATRQALQAQAQRFAWTDSRPDWGPGRIDPFNPVKFANLGLPDDGTIGNSDMMPLWGLGAVQSDKSVIRSMHWDGLMTDPYETVVAGAIGDGMTELSFPRTRQNLDRMEDFIRVAAPPPSPFRSDLPAGDPYRVDVTQVRRARRFTASFAPTATNPAATASASRSRWSSWAPTGSGWTWTPAARDSYTDYQKDYSGAFARFARPTAIRR